MTKEKKHKVTMHLSVELKELDKIISLIDNEVDKNVVNKFKRAAARYKTYKMD